MSDPSIFVSAVREQLAAKVSMEVAFEQALTLSGLQGKTVTPEDISALIFSWGYDIEMLKAIFKYKLPLTYMQIVQMHRVFKDQFEQNKDLFKGQHYLLISALTNLRGKQSIYGDFPNLNCICSEREAYDYLIDFISHPTQLALLKDESYATADNGLLSIRTPLMYTEGGKLWVKIVELRNYFILCLHTLTPNQVAKLYPVLEYRIPSSNVRSVVIPLQHLARLRGLFLTKRLPKSFVTSLFENAYPHFIVNAGLPKNLSVSEAQAFEIDTRKILELYEIIPKDPEQWAQAPLSYLRLFKSYLIEHNSPELAQELMKLILPQHESVQYINKPFPLEAIEELCRQTKMATKTQHAMLTHRSVPLLYCLVDKKHQAQVFEEITSQDAALTQEAYMPMACTIEFFKAHKDLINPNGLIPLEDDLWADPILVSWPSTKEPEAYVSALRQYGYDYLFIALTEVAVNLRQIKALNRTPGPHHLANALKQGHVTEILELLPYMSAHTPHSLLQQILSYDSYPILKYAATHPLPAPFNSLLQAQAQAAVTERGLGKEWTST